MNLNQWRNRDTVINWFKGIRNKHLYKFVIFDIKEFCPSITENLLKKALTFAEAHTLFSEDDKAIIHHVRKSLLLTISKLGLKETVGYLMSRWERTMGGGLSISWEFFTLQAIKIIREKGYRVV